MLDIPITIPVAVRTSNDYGLRFTVANITQVTPLAEAQLTFWGFPALESHDIQRFPKGSPGKPGRVPWRCRDELHWVSHAGGDSRSSVDRQSDRLHRSGSRRTLEVQTYQDPTTCRSAETEIPQTTGCEKMSSNRFSSRDPTTKEADSPSGSTSS